MVVYRLSIPIFIVSRTPRIQTRLFRTSQLYKTQPSYKSLCCMNSVILHFPGHLQILSSHQARTREFRTRNVMELKHTDKQTPCTKTLDFFLNNPNLWRFFHISRELHRSIRNQRKKSCPQASDVIYLFQSPSPSSITR